MAKVNVSVSHKVKTHEGAPATPHLDPVRQLRRSVMSCMLWEDEFYESGESIVKRIIETAERVPANALAAIAVEARTKYKLRHAPLMLLVALVKKGGSGVAKAVEDTIQRADELAEFVALYWKANPTGKKDAAGRDVNAPLSKQMKIGLAKAFQKFDAYQLAKYNREGAVKLRDVLFLVHAKPKDALQAETWKHLVNGTLATPDTWETELSAGKDKKETFTRLIAENKLFALALLRNLRNMIESSVKDDIIRLALLNMKTERVLPFRFITAANYAPRFEPELEQAMFKCLTQVEKMEGKTALLIDHSGSMSDMVSGKSQISRFDAASALAMILRENAENARIFCFSSTCKEVKPRRGFALRDQLKDAMEWGGTYLGQAVKHVNAAMPDYDRLIVITDEQSHDAIGAPLNKGYVVNVASAKNGVGYGPWLHIDGWSEAVLDYIRTVEYLGE